jgi:hypothetical protein
MKLAEDFYNKVMYGDGGIAPTFFPDYLTNNTRKYQQTRYAVECFSNRCICKDTLVRRLVRYCGVVSAEIVPILNKYITE